MKFETLSAFEANKNVNWYKENLRNKILSESEKNLVEELSKIFDNISKLSNNGFRSYNFYLSPIFRKNKSCEEIVLEFIIVTLSKLGYKVNQFDESVVISWVES